MERAAPWLVLFGGFLTHLVSPFPPLILQIAARIILSMGKYCLIHHILSQALQSWCHSKWNPIDLPYHGSDPSWFQSSGCWAPEENQPQIDHSWWYGYSYRRCIHFLLCEKVLPLHYFLRHTNGLRYRSCLYGPSDLWFRMAASTQRPSQWNHFLRLWIWKQHVLVNIHLNIKS